MEGFGFCNSNPRLVKGFKIVLLNADLRNQGTLIVGWGQNVRMPSEAHSHAAITSLALQEFDNDAAIVVNTYYMHLFLELDSNSVMQAID